MTAEGWNGQSIRQHVEDATAEAARAVEIAEAVEARFESWLHDLGDLAKPSATEDVIDAVPVNAVRVGGAAVDRAPLFGKVQFIRQEIEHFQSFMIEARGVREAVAVWRGLYQEQIALIQKGGAK